MRLATSIPPGFDIERRVPVCETCARVRAQRWVCRMCGTEVCGCNAPTQYLDGGCRCRDCERWYNSLPQLNARMARLQLPMLNTPPTRSTTQD